MYVLEWRIVDALKRGLFPCPFPELVNQWLNVIPFLDTVDSEVHIVHISHVIIADTMESLSSLT